MLHEWILTKRKHAVWVAGMCLTLLVLHGASVSAQTGTDVNGDGRADLVWRNTTNGATMVWQMTAAGALRGPVTFPGGLPLVWALR